MFGISRRLPPRHRPAGSGAVALQAPPAVAEPRRAEPSSRRVERLRGRSLPRPRPELVALLVLAAVLNLWALDQNGFANEYYSATVRSMASSWHDFLYGSFDASGVMTVDKPPLAFWVQALSVKLLGYHPLSMLVPQALMGVAAVGLVYDLTRRRVGRAAGAVAGLVLAVTPITVAISRHNNPDALLVLCCVAALWFVVRGLEDGGTRWLVLAGAAVGLGFEAKMAVALMVVPALAAAWLWIAPRGRLRAVRQLLAGGATMIGVGAAWPLLVALTPASRRPWVSGTSDNSIVSLIFDYNGVGRIAGQSGGPAGGAGPAGGGPGGGGGGGLFGGDAGPLRLLNDSLGGQAGWLLGAALVGLVALAVVTRLRRADARSGWLIAVGGSFLTIVVAFSAAQGIFHPYYVSLLAPFTAALMGGLTGLLLERGITARVVAPLAIAGGVVCELAILGDDTGELQWLPPLLIAVGLAGAVILALQLSNRTRAVALAVVLGALLVAPTTWAFQTLGHATNGTFPAGGPVASGMGGGPGGGGPPGIGTGPQGGGPQGAAGVPGPPSSGSTQGFGGPPSGAGFNQGVGPQGSSPGSAQGTGGPPSGGGMFGGRDSASLTRVLRYTRAHGGGTVAVSSQSGAAGSIISSGARDVAALGGFSGRESEVSVSWLADAVRAGKIRWVIADTSGGGIPQDGRAGSSTVMAAVQQACRLIPSSAYTSGSSSSSTASGSQSSGGLYDCRGLADALEALAT